MLGLRELTVGLWQWCTLLRVLCAEKHSTPCPRRKFSHAGPSTSFLALCEWHSILPPLQATGNCHQDCGRKPEIMCAHTGPISSPHAKSGAAFFSYFSSRWPGTGWEGRRLLCSAQTCIDHTVILYKHLSYFPNFPAFPLKQWKLRC